MTKLFFVVNTLQGGGAERVVSNLCNSLSESKFQVTVVCLNTEKQAYILKEGVKVISLVRRKNDLNIVNRIWFAGLTFFRLLKILRKERPACVISFMTSVNLWTGMTCSLAKIPFVVSERITPDYTINQFNYFLKWFSFIVYSKSKAVVIPAEGMIGCFYKNDVFRKLDNFKVIHNPVGKFTEGSGRGVHPRRFILGVGRLDRQKGFDTLIKAFSKVQQLGVDLLISGEGEERKNLSKLIEDLGLSDRVSLIGFKDNMQDYYSQCELFVLSSRNEGYPNALIEAMSMGCACISTNCEFGPSEIIIEGKNGLLVNVDDAEELAQQILNVLTNPILKARLVKNARLVNKTNSLENISAKWEKLILSHV